MIEKYTARMQSPLGVLQLEGDHEAVTSISFLNDPQPLVLTDNALLQLAIQELEAYFQLSLSKFSFPFRQRGTPFQQRVWQQLCAIPYSETISYKTLALRLGDEKCIRAAGTANGKNQLAIVVPCHRVIGSDRSLIGYAGGLWRKEWLLQHEGAMAPVAAQASLFDQP